MRLLCAVAQDFSVHLWGGGRLSTVLFQRDRPDLERRTSECLCKLEHVRSETVLLDGWNRADYVFAINIERKLFGRTWLNE